MANELTLGIGTRPVNMNFGGARAIRGMFYRQPRGSTAEVDPLAVMPPLDAPPADPQAQYEAAHPFLPSSWGPGPRPGGVQYPSSRIAPMAPAAPPPPRTAAEQMQGQPPNPAVLPSAPPDPFEGMLVKGQPTPMGAPHSAMQAEAARYAATLPPAYQQEFYRLTPEDRATLLSKNPADRIAALRATATARAMTPENYIARMQQAGQMSVLDLPAGALAKPTGRSYMAHGGGPLPTDREFPAVDRPGAGAEVNSETPEGDLLESR